MTLKETPFEVVHVYLFRLADKTHKSDHMGDALALVCPRSIDVERNGWKVALVFKLHVANVYHITMPYYQHTRILSTCLRAVLMKEPHFAKGWSRNWL